MKLLVLGGTLFLGRHVVEAALEAGHDVTIFTRGLTDPSAFPQVRRITGDREKDLSLLAGEPWDAVVDTWAKVPSMVRASARLLADHAQRYLFVSSISVYRPAGSALREASPALPAAAPDEPWNPERYGELKVACEAEATEAFGDRALIVRPGLIVGPHDPSDRFTYWPARIARGGDVLAPGRRQRTVQIIHARDLADWMIGMLGRGEGGVWNATGPAIEFGDLLDDCRAAAGSDARLEWVDDAWLIARGVEPWSELPVWLPEDSEFAHIMNAGIDKALAAGLRCRPALDTARETLAWDRSRDAGPRAAGMNLAREAELLRLWRSR